MAIITNDWTGTEYFKVNDFNHIECYVGNAKQSMYYYCFVMGFKPYAYKGPETGNKDSVSYVLRKNQIYTDGFFQKSLGYDCGYHNKYNNQTPRR